MHANASELLAATPTEWRTSLGKTVEAMRLTFRRLAHRWHPDHNADPQAGEVFARLQAARLAWKEAARPKVQTFSTDRGTRLEMRYATAYAHELGDTYIGMRTVLNAYSLSEADLAARAARADQLWRFANDAMRAQIRPLLPHAVTVHTTLDRVVHVSSRDPALIRLADLMAHLGRLDPQHVAWIGSGLWNLACYLEYSQIGHQAIGMDTVWVDPANHRVALLGGWAYAGRLGERWAALPGRTLGLASSAMLKRKVQDATLDHTLIRALLRELLGDASGMHKAVSTPDALAAFTRQPAGGTAVAQYTAWKQALVRSFGPPKFVEMALPPSHVYQEN